MTHLDYSTDNTPFVKRNSYNSVGIDSQFASNYKVDKRKIVKLVNRYKLRQTFYADAKISYIDNTIAKPSNKFTLQIRWYVI